MDAASELGAVFLLNVFGEFFLVFEFFSAHLASDVANFLLILVAFVAESTFEY